MLTDLEIWNDLKDAGFPLSQLKMNQNDCLTLQLHGRSQESNPY